MKAILLLLLAWWIAAGIGRMIMDRLRLLRDAPLERFVYASALGLALSAFGVFILGLLGLLSFWPITVWWLLLAAIGLRGGLANMREAIRAFTNRRSPSDTPSAGWERVFTVCVFAILAVCGLGALIACFLPPSGNEWDALAYHLADPKVFLGQHRITSLPTEHHSNFPFLMEMLFAVGLLYDGYALANLFHLLTAVLTVLALLAFCRRMISPVAGCAAALLFATMPFVFWEARIAYIDLGLGLFTTLAAFAVLSLPAPEDSTQANGERGAERLRWILLAGLLMGAALGIKYLALVPFVLVGVLLLWQRVDLRGLALYVGIALLLGAPWYVKNLILTHNPVYPYAYSLFPQSRYWSADRAATYQSEQSGFGYPRSTGQPVADTLRNLAQIPWTLLTTADRFDNPGNYTFMGQMGGLLAGLSFALLFLSGVPRVVRAIMVLGLAQLFSWFFVAQVSRYLVSIAPFFAVGAGYAAWRLMTQARGPSALWLRGLIPALLGGQALVLLWGVCLLPTRVTDPETWAVAQQQPELLGLLKSARLTSLSLPETVQVLNETGGTENALRKHLDIYSAMDYINHNTPPSDGVILYEETRGFYLDRPYLWGNRAHSAYIPYDQMQTGKDLTNWLSQRGIRTMLINLKWMPHDASLPALNPAGNEETALRLWYQQVASSTETWRNVLNDALRSGDWRPVFAQNGVIVLTLADSARAGSASQ